MRVPAVCAGWGSLCSCLLCSSLPLTHVFLDGAWQSGFSIKAKHRIANKTEAFLLRMSRHISNEDWSSSFSCHLWLNVHNLQANCKPFGYIYCPHRHFPFPVESHQTVLVFSPAWFLSEWLDDYFIPKNQRTPNTQQPAGSQHRTGWLRDMHQCIHCCLFQLPQVCAPYFYQASKKADFTTASLKKPFNQRTLLVVIRETNSTVK